MLVVGKRLYGHSMPQMIRQMEVGPTDPGRIQLQASRV